MADWQPASLHAAPEIVAFGVGNAKYRKRRLASMLCYVENASRETGGTKNLPACRF